MYQDLIIAGISIIVGLAILAICIIGLTSESGHSIPKPPPIKYKTKP